MDAVVAPLSHAQRRLWFLDRLEPGNPAYHIPIAVRLRGGLNHRALEGALSEIARRHETLRTTFAVENGKPVQVVREPTHFVLPVITVAGEQELARRLTLEARLPLNLVTGPVWRGALLRLNEADQVLLLTLHHIVADGWSLGVLAREVSSFYASLSCGQPIELPALTIQYADFAEWQNARLTDSALETQLAEVVRHLEGAPTALELPTDLPRPLVQSHRGALFVQQVPPAISSALPGIARREGVSLFMLLLAAFETLIFRFSRVEEMLIGTPVANRTRPETEDLVGFFVNTLVLRANLAGDPLFTELMDRTRRECLWAFERDEVPFERVVDAAAPARDRRSTPLFQVYFTLQNSPQGDLELPGIETSVLAVDTCSAKVDLTLGLEQSADGLIGRWEYCTDVFMRATILRLADHFENLLEAITDDPARRLSELPLLEASERDSLLRRGSHSASDFDCGTLHDWFTRQARRAPERVAVTCEGAALTYGDLERRANQLAWRLRRMGIGPDVPVGLCLDRSLEMIVAILGILKAGGAYVPLDPTYPRERLEFMLADSGIAALIKCRAPIDIDHPRCVDLETAAAELAAESTVSLPKVARPDNAAYVIYTSGSTGRPKGCVITHSNVTRLMRATEAWFKFQAQDVWTLFHSFAFDFSVWEMWGALIYGGRLLVVPHSVSRSPEAFHRLLELEGVTVLNQTPSAFRQLIAADAERPGSALSLRYVILGGEALEVSMLAPWLERHSDTSPQLVNMYGITETTVHVTYRPIAYADVTGQRGSVIGQRIPDLALYLVDASLEPVPVGVPGEILVGGAGLARGYLNRPELTAERFIPNPFGAGRLYRSGDLARWLPDGEMEYIGRIDQQVKIRGFRVETGEIERVLGALPGVGEVAVVARQQRPGEKRLVAYLTRQSTRAAPSPSQVREACRLHLPDYMVPAAYVYLDHLPLTANGKLDWQALPAPDPGETGIPTEYVEPAAPVERALAEVWARVLGVKTIGAQDNFFALGGDSILTIQVVSQAAKAGYKLRPKDLFDHQTLADLARAARPVSIVAEEASSVTPFTVSATDKEAVSRALPSGADVEDVYPLTPMQAGMLFHSTFDPESDVYFEQFSGDIRGPLVPAAFRAAWQGLLDRHPSLRTTFLWREVSMPLQVVHRYAELPWDEHDWSALAGAEQETAWNRVLAENRARGFTLRRAPLLNVTLVRFGRDHWRWLWSHYHALLDGWCLPLVLQELIAEYEYRVNGTGNPPAPGLPYRPYVEWVRIQSLPLAERYWRDALGGFEAAPPLALPPPDRGAATSTVGELELRLGASESAELRGWVRRQGLTLNTLFQGAWALLLARYLASDDVVFGVTVAGRPAELPEVERIIGLFINTLPLRVRIERSIEPAEWLRALQKAQAEMRQFEYSPLADVQAWSEAPRGQSLFETILVFENYPGEELVLGLRSSLRFDSLRAHEQTNYLLTAAVQPGVEIVLKLNYDARRLAAEPVERMLRCWRRLAVELTAYAGKRLDTLISLEPEELRSVLTWGRAPMDFGPPACIHDLVAEQAARSPEAPALLGPGREVTYRELMLYSSRLAVHLRRLGIRPEMRVAVCMEKSPELVTAWLGILLAGGAFVPLDPRFARERIADVVGDVRPVALILHQATAWIVSLTDLPVVWMDREVAELAGELADLSLPAIVPENLAYVIHTSGSTGRPKGVMLTHSGLANLALAHAAACGLGPGHRGLQFASASFDAAVWEVFTALGSGGALWLEARDAVPDPKAFAKLVQTANLDHATLPPAFLQALSPEDFPHLTTLFLAGEAAPYELYRCWANGRRLFNAYGPTEGTVCATMEEVSPSEGRVTLGRPIANLAVYLLDSRFNLVMPGGTGEIFIGGAGVARGYLDRPDLTAERFLPDPFAARPGTRIYRTGDLGRWTDDGRLEFLGRADAQVKIRGFRVEPAEIEAALAEHPAVAGALVLAHDDETGGKYLTAYAVRKAGRTVDPGELRRHLQERLPDYLFPRHLRILQTWPLTSAGKIDRRALISCAVSVPEAGNTGSLPLAGETERRLAAIWAAVLRTPDVGPDDNFFELGGDSILSLQIVARAHQAGLELSPRQIFQHPTVRRLAGIVVHRPQAGSPVTKREEGTVPLTPIQHWFFAQNQAEPNHWNQSLLLELRHARTPDVIAGGLAAVAAHHGSLRLRFHHVPPGSWTQSYSPPASAEPVELPVYPVARLADVTATLQASLDLTNGPLWRAALFEQSEGGAPLLFLTVHHLAVDGVSWRILAEDLATACAQLEQGKSVVLPPYACSFGAWAGALVQRAQEPALLVELPHWRALAETDADLPADFPPDTMARSAAFAETVSVELDAATTAALLRDATMAYRLTANELLLSALALSLSDWTGRSAHLVHLEGHGREDLGDALDVTRTVGWFTTLYPVRLECSPGADAGTLLKAVKEQLRSVPGRGFNFGLLRYLSDNTAVNAELASLPHANLSFNYLGQTDETLGPDAPFVLSRLVAAPGLSSAGYRAHLLDLNAVVSGGHLYLDWIYSTRVHRRATIEQLAENFLAQLRHLTAHCLATDAGGHTPSDFTLVDLNSGEIDAILGDLADRPPTENDSRHE
jgi:amino acid adenylation domain-containing protein/non-ribosomal peptide synthase protein (TIGR01720 family)